MSMNTPSRQAARLRLVEEHTRCENTHDLECIMETFGPEAVLRANAENQVGRVAVKSFYGEFLHGFPDLRLDVVSTHCAVESIAVEMMLSGTHTDTWMGVPPSGRRFEVQICAIYTFDGEDRLLEERAYWDNASIARQLGL